MSYFTIRNASLALLIMLGMIIAKQLATQEIETNECDTQAAHPTDGSRMSQGVAMEKIIPKKAIAACEAAAANYPKEARFSYQLGRAYESAGRMDDAIAAYRKSSGLDYPMAFYNLGVSLAERGEIEAAKTNLQAAEKKGVVAASDKLKTIIFSSDGFSNPKLFEAINSGSLSGTDSKLTIYMTSFVGLFHNTSGCSRVANNSMQMKLAQMSRKAVMGEMFGALAKSGGRGSFEAAAVGGYQAGQNVAQGLSAQADKAQNDAELFYKRYGCGSIIAKSFFSNLERWLYTN